MRVIAFTGMPGAGKSVAVEAAKEAGVPVTRMGDAVWDEVKSRNLPLTNDVVGTVASELRARKGAGIWAERTIERVAKLESPLVVIDGVRSPEEVDNFRQALGHDFFLVAVHAAPDLRLTRLMDRKRPDDVQTRAEFDARDARELGWGIGKVIALADVVVVNHGEIEDLKARVRVLLDDALREVHRP